MLRNRITGEAYDKAPDPKLYPNGFDVRPGEEGFSLTLYLLPNGSEVCAPQKTENGWKYETHYDPSKVEFYLGGVSL